MPGFVIHLAVAKEYIRKHPKEIKDANEFFHGVIAPDFTQDKSKTHYGPCSSQTNLGLYLKSNEIHTDYDKGYFLHLITDYVFYQKYYMDPDERVYNDYSILNASLIKKYKVELLEEIKQYATPMTGELSILEEDKIYEFIEEVSNMQLDTVEKRIKNNNDII